MLPACLLSLLCLYIELLQCIFSCASLVFIFLKYMFFFLGEGYFTFLVLNLENYLFFVDNTSFIICGPFFFQSDVLSYSVCRKWSVVLGLSFFLLFICFLVGLVLLIEAISPMAFAALLKVTQGLV